MHILHTAHLAFLSINARVPRLNCHLPLFQGPTVRDPTTMDQTTTDPMTTEQTTMDPTTTDQQRIKYSAVTLNVKPNFRGLLNGKDNRGYSV